MIRSPKRVARNTSWYPYYAAYSSDFVADALDLLDLSCDALVLDPWNGTGTTTLGARNAGFRAIGFDLNPALVIVARGRHLHPKFLPRLAPLTATIFNTASRRTTDETARKTDPLTLWFDRSTVARLRSIETSIVELLVPSQPTAEADAGWSPLASFFYVALFRTVRNHLAVLRSSNPTWLKPPSRAHDRVQVPRSVIETTFDDEVKNLTQQIATNSCRHANGRADLYLAVGTSEQLPLADHSVDAIIGSPPYCTRIDYAVATAPELAVLGYDYNTALKALRDRMIGTPTMTQPLTPLSPDWGKGCLTFLERVRSHPSRASGTYYFRYFTQYFNSLWRSFRELTRVASASAVCVIVVQDSFYKEIHNDLPLYCQEMGQKLGWTIDRQFDFPVARTMASVNKQAKIYRKASSAVESVLVFQKQVPFDTQGDSS